MQGICSGCCLPSLPTASPRPSTPPCASPRQPGSQAAELPWVSSHFPELCLQQFMKLTARKLRSQRWQAAPGVRGSPGPLLPAHPHCELLNLQEMLSQQQMKWRTISTEDNYQLYNSCPENSRDAPLLHCPAHTGALQRQETGSTQ